jgi:hypothetical protein
LAIWGGVDPQEHWRDVIERAAARAAKLRADREAKKKGGPRSASSYWLGDSAIDRITEYRSENIQVRHSPEYLMKLANIRKGIANFVRIVTGKDIPVHFSTGKDSYATSNDIIVISATNDPAKFDANVGTALHEAAHLILSKPTKQKESVDWFGVMTAVQDHPEQFFDAEIEVEAGRLNRTSEKVFKDFHFIMNVLEDRRIDKWMYVNAPGYRPYYEAMYKAVWHNDYITKGLGHPATHRPLVKYYQFHLCNMTNEAASPDALPGLKEIWQLIDLPNIRRLGGTDVLWTTYEYNRKLVGGTLRYRMADLPEMVRIAITILKIWYKNSKLPHEVPEIEDLYKQAKAQGRVQQRPAQDADKSEDDPMQDQNFDQPDDQEFGDIPDEEEKDAPIFGSEGDRGQREEDSEESTGGTGQGIQPKGEDSQDGDNTGGQCDHDESNGPTKQTLKRFWDDKEFERELERQSKALEGEMEKESVTEEMKHTLDAMEGAGAELKESGKGLAINAHCPVIVYNKLTQQLVESPAFPFVAKYGHLPSVCDESARAVEKGINLGSMLAHRIRVIADEATVTFTRRTQGRLDKRLLSGLGYGVQNVFSHTQIERLDPVLVHLTIDASGSMMGDRWYNAMLLAAALAKCSEKTRNMDVVVSIRAGSHSGSSHAVMAIIFDSRVDQFAKVTRYWPYLRPYGSTPEALCFEPIMEKFIRGNRNIRKFFVNVSDGEPSFSFQVAATAKEGKKSLKTGQRGRPRLVDTIQFESIYYGDELAINHCAQQVQRLKEAGITVMSYFVGRSGNENIFRRMYGKDAAFIDPESLPAVAKTLNAMFLGE